MFINNIENNENKFGYFNYKPQLNYFSKKEDNETIRDKIINKFTDISPKEIVSK